MPVESQLRTSASRSGAARVIIHISHLWHIACDAVALQVSEAARHFMRSAETALGGRNRHSSPDLGTGP